MAAEAKLDESNRLMLEKAQQDAAKAAANAQQKSEDTYDFGPKGFTGRYRLGPEVVPVRIVMFGAFTCQFCKQMESIALDLQSKNPQKVSFSFKHFPMCADCNPHSEKGKDPEEHRNACWAARCAEACAIFAGANAALAGEDQWTASNDAFWKAHKWLFSIGGNFTDASLMAGLKEQGFNADKVTELMTKPAANAPVVKDAEEGHALGLFQTPMIFINGIELKGWQQPGALERAVQGLLASNAPAADARGDKPDLAKVAVIEWWRAEQVKSIPAEKSPRAIGKADAPVQVVVFGDFQEENTQKVDKMIRAWVTGPGGLAKAEGETKPIRYIFKNFPGDKSCNDKLYKTFFEFGCMTAKAAEATGVVGGEAAYWKMHDWLINNPGKMGLDSIKKGARAIGLDADAVITAMGNAAVTAAIQEDVAAGHAIGVGQIPAIYVNGKFLKTWNRENDNVLERVIEDAAGPAKK
jgi:protein-disulfide isomerase